MACIYAIHNTAVDRYYIGSTMHSADYRWGSHLTQLRAGRHFRALQPDWQTYGEASFTCIPLLDLLDPAARFTYERLVYDQWKAAGALLYNQHRPVPNRHLTTMIVHAAVPLHIKDAIEAEANRRRCLPSVVAGELLSEVYASRTTRTLWDHLAADPQPGLHDDWQVEAAQGYDVIAEERPRDLRTLVDRYLERWREERGIGDG